MNTTEKLLTSKDICSIIRSCSQSGVREFTFGSLTIRFGIKDFPIDTQTSVYSHPQDGDIKPEIPQDNISELHDALLAVENPMAFEERQLLGEIDDE